MKPFAKNTAKQKSKKAIKVSVRPGAPSKPRNPGNPSMQRFDKY